MSDRNLKSSEVMERLGYSCRKAFWQCVYSEAIPHVRINARKIVFPESDFQSWFDRRRSNRR